MLKEQTNIEGNKRIARNSLFLSVRMVIVLGITLITTRELLKTLGVEDYGVYNVVCGFVSMFTFLNTSMSNGIQRFYNFELGKNGVKGARNVYGTSLVIQFILAVIIIMLTESFGMWYLHNKMVIPCERLIAAEWVFQLSILGFFFLVIQAPFTAAVMAHERMDFFAKVSILDAVLKLFIVFIIPIFERDYLIVYGMLLALTNILNFLLYYIYDKRNFIEIRLLPVFNKSIFLSMIGFSSWNLFGSFSGVVRDQGMNLLLNFFFGPIVNAARGVATQINGGIQSFVQNITTPVRPQVIQSYAIGNKGRTMNLTYSISKLSCFFLTLMAIPVSLEIDSILEIWLGDNVPIHTSTFAIIVIMCSYQGNLNSAISGVVHAIGKMRNYQLSCSLVKMSSIPVAYLLLKFGFVPECALLSVFVFDILGHVAGLFVLKTLIDFSIIEYIKLVVIPIIKVLILSLIVSYPVHYFIDNSIIRFFAVLSVSSLSIVSSSYYIGLNKNEKKLVSQIIKKIFNKK